MKVYKYLLSVIVLLGLISCSSEESDFEKDVVSTVGQYTVAFNLSNDITTKAVGEIDASVEEANIEYFTLFICSSNADEAIIFKKMFFKGNSCTFNLKLENGKTDYYAYAVANVTESDLAIVYEGQTLANLKTATASISRDGAAASMLPKVGGKTFEIQTDASDVQKIGNIDVYQLVSGLQLQVKTNFVGGTNPKFVVNEIKWDSFSAKGEIGGVNVDLTNVDLNCIDPQSVIFVNSDVFVDVGSEFYTFPNIQQSAELYVQGEIYDNGAFVKNLSTRINIGRTALAANTKYNVQLTVKGTFSKDTQITLDYEVMKAEEITVKIPEFN